VLCFTPTAWAKLLFFCHYGDTEIGGFGLSAPDDLLRIEDFQTVRQVTSSVRVAFDDTAIADFYEQQVDLGRQPREFSRCWLHTHPGSSPAPSAVDEETFARAFESSDWAVMMILARGGKTYARLRFNVGPGGHLLLPVTVDYGAAFGPSDHDAWEAEYQRNIRPESWSTAPERDARSQSLTAAERLLPDRRRTFPPEPGDFWEELDLNDPAVLAAWREAQNDESFYNAFGSF
jgi:proteasome lid subunit RPN8/RPN11